MKSRYSHLFARFHRVCSGQYVYFLPGGQRVAEIVSSSRRHGSFWSIHRDGEAPVVRDSYSSCQLRLVIDTISYFEDPPTGLLHRLLLSLNRTAGSECLVLVMIGKLDRAIAWYEDRPWRLVEASWMRAFRDLLSAGDKACPELKGLIDDSLANAASLPFLRDYCTDHDHDLLGSVETCMSFSASCLSTFSLDEGPP